MARIDLVDLAQSYSGNDADPESFALKPISMTWKSAVRRTSATSRMLGKRSIQPTTRSKE